ncbi:MAG: fimbrillin family protein [Muribaculaceae bacterium]|nr:fimbrillin family protein [Muribaculaceae bacterium]
MKLNKFNSLIGLCVATVAVSCSDALVDDVNRYPVGGEETDMISFIVADDYTRGGSFGNRPGLSTRGSVTTSDNIYTEGNAFAIYGDMTDSSKSIVLFNGDDVTYDNSNQWTYSNPRYWFADYEYSFVAMYPKTIPGLKDLNYENNRLAFSYTLPSNYSDATDILIAGHRRYYDSSSSDPTSVELSFGHIMTRLNFVAKIDAIAKDLGIEIKKISIKGVASNATYEVLPADIKTGFSETSDFSVAAWKISQTPGRKSLAKEIVTSQIEINTKEDGSKEILLFPSSDPLLVVPQSVTSDIIVELTYSQTGKNDQTVEGRLRTAASAHGYQWAQGRSYTYTFNLGVEDFILFDKPVVEAWDEDEGGKYIVVG